MGEDSHQIECFQQIVLLDQFSLNSCRKCLTCLFCSVCVGGVYSLIVSEK